MRNIISVAAENWAAAKAATSDGFVAEFNGDGSNFSRRSELETLQAKIDGLASRLERAEDTIDRLRNGSHR